MKLNTLAEALGCRLAGSGEIEITGVATVEQAGPARSRFWPIPNTPAKRSIHEPALFWSPSRWLAIDIACLVSENPYLDFARALACSTSRHGPPPGSTHWLRRRQRRHR